MKLFGTMKLRETGCLEIGGCCVEDVTREYGTPLYVYDTKLIRDKCSEFKTNFVSDYFDTDVIYASKAFLTKAMCNLLAEQDMSIDVVSGGELYTAISSGFPAERIYMHGNNKTREELEMAIEYNVGTIIVDNEDEVEELNEICEAMKRNAKVLLRVNPGIDAHTHEYIQTANHDSKFGVSIYCDNTKELIRKIVESENLNLKGYHIHIGSQILLESSYYASIKVIVDFINKIKEEFGYEAEELNLGGGFGVYYSEEDTPFPLGDFLKTLTNKIHIEMVQKGLSINKVMIEPGRSIVANSGTTLYKVGNMKDTYGGKKYIFVDGGMTDNPRKALYDSKYEACIANRLFDNNEDVYTIAGKCCESGDILIKDINITVPKKGDVLAVFGTGAYNYSMASNYNRILKPGVVFLEDGKAIEVVKRESYRDLLRNDI